ncbi:MAG: beta-ketoacyl-ACP reductase [Desulfobacterales bacterium]|nr:MAG: beta-ketoacyl-ACP reductase [Desulfobacterales bacterium]
MSASPEAAARTFIVTGGSRGIGRAICRGFAGPDTRVYFNYASNTAAAEETVAAVEAAGGTAAGIPADVTSEEGVAAFFKQVAEETGRVDVLVNNAGITRDALFIRMKEKDWDDVLAINLKGAFICSRAAARIMMKQRFGRIINISSVVGVTGNPGQVNYSASKAGLIGMSKSLARELSSRNITVNVVAPGLIDTDMTRSLNEKARESMMSAIPLGRAGRPEDVAAAVRFLASDDAAYITGHVLNVNGGMHM